MTPNRMLIANGLLLTLDDRLGVLERGDILVEGDRIAHVGPHIEAEDAELVDATDRIVIPGLIDSHRHIWESILRNVAADWQGSHYFSGVRGKLGRYFGPDEIYAANLIGTLEALDVGITTLFDWSHCINTPDCADAAVNALFESGARAIFGLGDPNDEWLPMSDVPSDPELARRIRNTYFSSDDQLVTMAAAPRGPEFTTPEVTRKDIALARELGLKMSIHVGNGDRLPANHSPILFLHEQGLIDDDVLFVHCNASSDEELRILKDCGCRPPSVTVDSEVHFGLGWPAVLRLMAIGLRPSLGIDIVINALGDMFGAFRSTAALGRAMQHDQSRVMPDRLAITARDLIEMATFEGARSCWMEDKIGSLTPGKQADIVLVRCDTLHHAPLNNPWGAVALGSHGGDVDTVFVAGRAVKRAGELVNVDATRVRRLATEARDRVFERALAAGEDVALGGEWLPEPYVARTVGSGQA
jgi:5-methylthioadenosine/S-adenosylhomocysteine deaminase